MAMVDSLDIEIRSSAKNAKSEIDTLIKSLGRLSASLKFDTGGLDKLSASAQKAGKSFYTLAKSFSLLNSSGLRSCVNDIGRMSAAMQLLGNVKLDTSKIKELSTHLRSLSSIDFSKLHVAEEAIRSLSGLSKVSIPEFDAKNVKSFTDFIASIQKLDAGNIPQIADGIAKISSSLSLLGSVNLKESGINGAINALNRLFQIDLSKFNSDSFDKVTNSIKNLGTIPDISSSLSRFVSSLAKLANAGESIKKVSDTIPKLSQNLKQAIEKIRSAGDMSDSINAFVQAIGRLASAGNKTGQTAEQLGALADSVRGFAQSMSNVPDVSENILRLLEAMARLSGSGGQIERSISNMPSLFDRVARATKSAASGIKNAFKMVSGTVKKAANVVSNAARAIISSLSTIVQKSAAAAKSITSSFFKIGNSDSALKKTGSGFGNLLKTLVAFKGVTSFVNLGKSALTLGSDITEVENVVDVAFGSMAQHAYGFASTATEQFGLSELAAKQYSGTMMAMLKSSGVATSSAAKMSTTLAGLAGDIASFYNIDTDTAFEKLRSGIAGQVMPLRQLGINMTVANLNAYAMSKGITKAYKDMSQGEQAMLRYNYILEHTGDAQGDFARTSGTWANQVRLLRLNFQSLAATIGQGLIAAILPVIKWLNKLMAILMKAAQAFKSFMYTLTGKKMEVKTGGFINDVEGVEGLEDAGEDASSGLDKAADSAKKLKKALSVLPFDELNQLSDNSDDILDDAGAGAGIGDIGGLGAGELGLGDIGMAGEGIEGPINEWAKKIREAFLAHDWHGVGKTIAEMLNAGLQKVYDVINWGNVGPKIEKFIDAFTTAFNALVYHFDWDLLGRTIGAGINTIVNTFNLLVEKINFELIGEKLSTGLRGMLNEVKWRSLGNALGNYFMISWRMFEGFVNDMWRKSDLTQLSGWAELGMSLARGINGLFEKIDFGRIGTSLSSAFNGLTETLNYLSLNIRWNQIADNISNGFTNAIDGIDLQKTGGTIGQFVTKLLDMMLRAAENTPWDEFGEKVAQFLLNIPWAELIGKAFDLISSIFGRILSGFLGEMLNNSELIGNTVARLVNGAVDRLRKLTASVDWEDVGHKISNGLNRMINGIQWAEAGQTLSDFVMGLLATFKTVAEETDWEGFGRGIGDFLSSIDWAGIFGTVFDIAVEAIGGVISGFADTTAGKVSIALLTAFGLMKLAGLGLSVGNLISKELTGQSLITRVFTAITGEGGIITRISGFLTSGFSRIFSEGGLLSAVTTGATNLVSRIGSILGTIGSVVFSPQGLLIAGIVAGVALIVIHWDEIKEAAGKLRDWIGEKFNAIKENISSAWEGAKKKTSEIWNGIKTTVGNTWEGLKTSASEKFGAIKDKISTTWSNVKEKTSTTWGNIKTNLGEKWSSIKTSASEKFGLVKKNVTDAWSALSKNTGTTWGNIKKSMSDTANGASKTVKSAFGDMSKKVKDIWGGMSDAVGKAFNGLTNVLKKPINAIIGFLNKLISGVAWAVNGIADMLNSINVKIPDWVPGVGGGTLGFNLPKWTPGKISYLAKGGLVTDITPAVIGEGGRKEAVLPLENKRTMSMIADSIVGSVSGTGLGLTKEEMVEAVQEGVVMALINNQHNTTPINVYATLKTESDEVLARAVSRGMAKNNYRMKPSTA